MKHEVDVSGGATHGDRVDQVALAQFKGNSVKTGELRGGSGQDAQARALFGQSTRQVATHKAAGPRYEDPGVGDCA
jgi:hypothetical protein